MSREDGQEQAGAANEPRPDGADPAPRIQVLIADDEPLARERLAQLVAAFDDLEIVGEAANGKEAWEMIERLRPALVFLDVQMPVLDGFEVIEAVGRERMPVTIFTTAYDGYALQAFEAHAVQYLLKPVGHDRFAAAVRRARRLLPQAGERDAPVHPRPPAGYPVRFAVKVGAGYQFVRAADIQWAEAADNYAALHTRGGTFLARMSMSTLETRLDPAQFIRVRASAIVRVASIHSITPYSATEYELLLENGTRIVSSRRYRARLKALLKP